MFRHRSKIVKWSAIVSVIGIIGWLVWQNQSAEDAGWIFSTAQPLTAVGNPPDGTRTGVSGLPGSTGDRGRSSSDVNAGAAGGGAESGSGVRSIGKSVSIRSGGNTAGLDADGAAHEEPVKEAEEIAVHAAGAVQKPGVYYLPVNARVVDVVKAAGGVTAQADLNAINLASPVADGDQVMIPRTGEDGQGDYTIRGGVTSGVVRSSLGNGGGASADIDRAGGSSANRATSAQGYRPGSTAGRVNLNTASAEELMSLPGIGESKAAAIIRYREKHGRFQRPEDLMAVGGIGEKTFAGLRDRITI